MLGLGLGITAVLPRTEAQLHWYNPSTGYSIPSVLPQCSWGKTAVFTAVLPQTKAPLPRYNTSTVYSIPTELLVLPQCSWGKTVVLRQFRGITAITAVLPRSLLPCSSLDDW